MDTEQMQPLVTSGLKATKIKLVRKLKEVDEEDNFFEPDMCHQVFGDREIIFGYNNLSINIFYNASTFQCYVTSSYDAKLKTNEELNLAAEDYMEKLNPWLPHNFFTNKLDFTKCLSKKNKLKPFGIKLHSFTLTDGSKKGSDFEIYTCNNKDPGYPDFHKRLETLIVWFIDGANFIDIDDEKWRFYILYEKNTLYYPIGYCTVYEYYLYPDNRRYRISQFIIFPPFQKMGLGTELLGTVYKHLFIQPKIYDITVEDPSDRFQLMRDFVDAKLCSTLSHFSPFYLKSDFSKEMITEARSTYKINEKQCRRVYEILRLFNLNQDNSKEFNAYKLMIKNRLNNPSHKKRKNKKFKKLFQEISDDHHLKMHEKNFENLMRHYRRVICRLQQDRKNKQ